VTQQLAEPRNSAAQPTAFTKGDWELADLAFNWSILDRENWLQFRNSNHQDGEDWNEAFRNLRLDRRHGTRLTRL